jgi:hypothetical protein
MLPLREMRTWGIPRDPRLVSSTRDDCDVLPVFQRDHAILKALHTCLKKFMITIRVVDVYNEFRCPGIHLNPASLNQAISSVIKKVHEPNDNDHLMKGLLKKGSIEWSSMRGTDGNASLVMDDEGAQSLTVAVELWLFRMLTASRDKDRKDTIIGLWRPSRSARQSCAGAKKYNRSRGIVSPPPPLVPVSAPLLSLALSGVGYFSSGR